MAREHLGSGRRILLGDDEVDVVGGLGRTARPQRVAARQREVQSTLLEGDRHQLECLTQSRPYVVHVRALPRVRYLDAWVRSR
jgi:hypothetical protein